MEVIGTVAAFVAHPRRPRARPRARSLHHGQARRDHGRGVRDRLPAANRLGHVARHAVQPELDPARRLRAHARRGRRRRDPTAPRAAASTDAEIDHAMEGAFNRRPIWVRVGVLLAGVAMNFVLAGVALRRGAAAMPQPLEPRTAAPCIEIQAGQPGRGGARGGRHHHRGRRSDVRAVARPDRATSSSRAGEPVTLHGHPRRRDDDGDGHAARASPMRSWPRAWAPSASAGRPDERRRGATDRPRTRSTPWSSASRPPAGARDRDSRRAGRRRRRAARPEPRGRRRRARADRHRPGAPGGCSRRRCVAARSFVGILSINLAVLNVLPFPPLDGGRIAVVLHRGGRAGDGCRPSARRSST